MTIVHFHRNGTVGLGWEAGPAPLHQRRASQGWGRESTASRLHTQCFPLTASMVREHQEHPATARGANFVVLSRKLRWRVGALWQCPSALSSRLYFHCVRFHCSLSLVSKRSRTWPHSRVLAFFLHPSLQSSHCLPVPLVGVVSFWCSIELTTICLRASHPEAFFQVLPLWPHWAPMTPWFLKLSSHQDAALSWLSSYFQFSPLSPSLAGLLFPLPQR